MRTTLDLPDLVFRRLKARAAIEGLSLKDLLERYVTAGLQRAETPGADRVAEDAAATTTPFVSAFDVLADGCGAARSGEPDLATHPRHMTGFGRD